MTHTHPQCSDVSCFDDDALFVDFWSILWSQKCLTRRYKFNDDFFFCYWKIANNRIKPHWCASHSFGSMHCSKTTREKSAHVKHKRQNRRRCRFFSFIRWEKSFVLRFRTIKTEIFHFVESVIERKSHDLWYFLFIGRRKILNEIAGKIENPFNGWWFDVRSGNFISFSICCHTVHVRFRLKFRMKHFWRTNTKKATQKCSK